MTRLPTTAAEWIGIMMAREPDKKSMAKWIITKIALRPNNPPETRERILADLDRKTRAAFPEVLSVEFASAGTDDLNLIFENDVAAVAFKLEHF